MEKKITTFIIDEVEVPFVNPTALLVILESLIYGKWYKVDEPAPKPQDIEKLSEEEKESFKLFCERNRVFVNEAGYLFLMTDENEEEWTEILEEDEEEDEYEIISENDFEEALKDYGVYRYYV